MREEMKVGLKELEVPNKFVLKWNKNIPKIYVPKDKLPLLINWHNEDLKDQKEYPQPYKEGYIILNNDLLIKAKDQFRKIIINQYHNDKLNMPYLQYEPYRLKIKELLNQSETLIIHFLFKNNNDPASIKIYLKNGILLMDSTDVTGYKNEYKVNPIITENWYKDKDTWTSFMIEFAGIVIQIAESILWYLSTSTNLVKYIYNQSDKNKTLEEIIDPKSLKIKSTPIYDLSKITERKTGTLIKRRTGWSYSHSFQVCGHYRHYKSGKVIFIKSYIKGKGKEFQKQDTIISLEK